MKSFFRLHPPSLILRFPMSLRLAVNCPFCKRPMATSAAFAGQMIACPNCRGEFLLNSPALAPSPNTPAAPIPATTLHRPEPAPVETAPAIALAVPPASAPNRLAAPQPALPTSVAPAALPPANTARFKTAASTAPAIAAAADGKLPELQLADSMAAGAAGESGEKAVPLWLACMAVVGSTVVSVFLLLGDVPGQKSIESRHAEARQQLAAYYGTNAAALAPYQVLLREAQQAHSRGDRGTERQRYRQVLALLRAERRSKYESVTGSPASDEQLAESLSVLLGNE
jgi:hypothetical protein